MTPILIALLAPTFAGIIALIVQVTRASDRIATIQHQVSDLNKYAHALYHDTLGPMVQDHELRLALIESHLKIGRQE